MLEKKIVRLTPREDVVRFLGTSPELVQRLPAWKRGVLEVSSLTTNTEARTPIATQVEEKASSRTVKP
jgi:hypothetical protein